LNIEQPWVHCFVRFTPRAGVKNQIRNQKAEVPSFLKTNLKLFVIKEVMDKLNYGFS